MRGTSAGGAGLAHTLQPTWGGGFLPRGRAFRDVSSVDTARVLQACPRLHSDLPPSPGRVVLVSVRFQTRFPWLSSFAGGAAEATEFSLQGCQDISLSSSASRGPVSAGHLSPGPERVRNTRLRLFASLPSLLATCCRRKPRGLFGSPLWRPPPVHTLEKILR